MSERPAGLEQMLIGSALAFGVAAVFAGVEMAGSLVDLSIGFSLAQVINPTLNTSSTAMAQVYSLVATMVFLSTGAYEVMIAGIVGSFTSIPLDQSPQIGAMTALVEHQMAMVVPLALQIAAPVLGSGNYCMQEILVCHTRRPLSCRTALNTRYRTTLKLSIKKPLTTLGNSIKTQMKGATMPVAKRPLIE